MPRKIADESSIVTWKGEKIKKDDGVDSYR